jgi:hypothetical protein
MGTFFARSARVVTPGPLERTKKIRKWQMRTFFTRLPARLLERVRWLGPVSGRVTAGYSPLGVHARPALRLQIPLWLELGEVG